MRSTVYLLTLLALTVAFPLDTSSNPGNDVDKLRNELVKADENQRDNVIRKIINENKPFDEDSPDLGIDKENVVFRLMSSYESSVAAKMMQFLTTPKGQEPDGRQMLWFNDYLLNDAIPTIMKDAFGDKYIAEQSRGKGQDFVVALDNNLARCSLLITSKGSSTPSVAELQLNTDSLKTKLRETSSKTRGVKIDEGSLIQVEKYIENAENGNLPIHDKQILPTMKKILPKMREILSKEGAVYIHQHTQNILKQIDQHIQDILKQIDQPIKYDEEVNLLIHDKLKEMLLSIPPDYNAPIYTEEEATAIANCCINDGNFELQHKLVELYLQLVDDTMIGLTAQKRGIPNLPYEDTSLEKFLTKFFPRN